MTNLPNRKKRRLSEYDYSQPGAYFITICTQNRVEHFGDVSTSSTFKTSSVLLSDIGQVVNDELHKLSTTYPGVNLDASVIMPNHVHLILNITGFDSPSISDVVRLWKTSITKKIGISLWQKSFHDHVIRNDVGYERLLEYIENNPAQWELDSLNPVNN